MCRSASSQLPARHSMKPRNHSALDPTYVDRFGPSRVRSSRRRRPAPRGVGRPEELIPYWTSGRQERPLGSDRSSATASPIAAARCRTRHRSGTRRARRGPAARSAASSTREAARTASSRARIRAPTATQRIAWARRRWMVAGSASSVAVGQRGLVQRRPSPGLTLVQPGQPGCLPVRRPRPRPRARLGRAARSPGRVSPADGASRRRAGVGAARRRRSGVSRNACSASRPPPLGAPRGAPRGRLLEAAATRSSGRRWRARGDAPSSADGTRSASRRVQRPPPGGVWRAATARPSSGWVKRSALPVEFEDAAP